MGRFDDELCELEREGYTTDFLPAYKERYDTARDDMDFTDFDWQDHLLFSLQDKNYRVTVSLRGGPKLALKKMTDGGLVISKQRWDLEPVPLRVLSHFRRTGNHFHIEGTLHEYEVIQNGWFNYVLFTKYLDEAWSATGITNEVYEFPKISDIRLAMELMIDRYSDDRIDSA